MRRPTLLLALAVLPPLLPVSAAAVQHADASARHAAGGSLDRQLAQRKAEVAELQQGVAQQESLSRDAAARLRQQDQAIAQLRRQLQALKSAPAPAATAAH